MGICDQRWATPNPNLNPLWLCRSCNDTSRPFFLPVSLLLCSEGATCKQAPATRAD